MVQADTLVNALTTKQVTEYATLIKMGWGLLVALAIGIAAIFRYGRAYGRSQSEMDARLKSKQERIDRLEKRADLLNEKVDGQVSEVSDALKSVQAALAAMAVSQARTEEQVKALAVRLEDALTRRRSTREG